VLEKPRRCVGGWVPRVRRSSFSSEGKRPKKGTLKGKKLETPRGGGSVWGRAGPRPSYSGRLHRKWGRGLAWGLN